MQPAGQRAPASSGCCESSESLPSLLKIDRAAVLRHRKCRRAQPRRCGLPVRVPETKPRIGCKSPHLRRSCPRLVLPWGHEPCGLVLEAQRFEVFDELPAFFFGQPPADPPLAFLIAEFMAGVGVARLRGVEFETAVEPVALIAHPD